ncbi:MDR family oxidoreductase [Neisseria leonii]|uniref:MDR family oxidoreductase n=2 Tax=Neisseria leonii TaxID=2995413 RepID=A0AAQ3V0U1_9NEIS|nr:MDR family oxidoreductase [Neisseria sp. 51.81]
MFPALMITRDPDYRAAWTQLAESDLPEGEVDVRVRYSSLNYKDALALTGKGPVVRTFPLVAGIDFAGEVLADSSGRFAPGDEVILNGWGAGERYWGGLAARARVPAAWLVKKPGGLNLRDTMALGTAGYTAALAVGALQRNGVRPQDGEIVVSGANGGVGGFALALLAALGYRSVALTRRTQETDYLCRVLGAADVMDAAEYAQAGKPLSSERWAGGIDSLGSHTLANICAATRYGGTVAACGLAQGMDFPATVAPFILRGVQLAGIDSVMRPLPVREQAWQMLAQCLGGSPVLGQAARTIAPDEVLPAAEAMMAGRLQGRVVVDMG